ncbi:hypothetical protein GSI_05948 [Ganoderma sinense ZZ0214-1]|uniref:Uncharacterized protein n=1 Tax=Ganoderma sinense ZZ0214-1 TaxID=1077348 RepID=A0A2G8SBW5_9APHY|nr:hypothetical protein GSI_05948 [Ganoderma sinense ZZ0214-1]
MPVFTTSSALRARRGSRTPSLPLNVNTAPTQPTSDATPASPNATQPVSPFLESESIVLKAKRAYDRDRQRAKKRKERAERERERTAALAPVPAVHSREGSTKHAGRGNAKPKLVTAEDKDVAVRPLPTSPVEEIIADVVERAMLARGDAAVSVRVVTASKPREVDLEQLMKPAKARKSKGESILVSGLNVKLGRDANASMRPAGDFEVVSDMPVVIALDDQIPDDAELDEPWEHISADELDEKRESPPSYATVLANAI